MCSSDLDSSRRSRFEPGRGQADLVATLGMNEDYLREMLRFAVRWEPYGGGSAEEIFVAFGLDEAEYFTRVDLDV